MRLQERTLTQVHLARRIAQTGSLGGLAEGFSGDTVALRASVLPDGGEMDVRQKGPVSRARLRLLVPGDAQAACGDGVWVNGVLWRIIAVQRWTAHVEWICEETA